MNFTSILILAGMTLVGTSQGRSPNPTTIEVLKDVRVMNNTKPDESGDRAVLYIYSEKVKEFELKKGQRFVMTKMLEEGGCLIRINKKEYGISSCHWLEGFSDHRADIFRIVADK
jgi:hypothetical protein